MKKTCLLSTLLAFSLISCNDNLDNVVPENNQEKSCEYHGVPIEDALANLEEFLVSLDNPTRADNPRRIGRAANYIPRLSYNRSGYFL